jgi:hypothetical protein
VIGVHLHYRLNAAMFEHFFRECAVCATQYEHALDATVRQHRYVTHHLVKNEFICATRAHDAINQHHSPKAGMLEHQRLVSGILDPIDNAIGVKGEPDAGRYALLK